MRTAVVLAPLWMAWMTACAPASSDDRRAPAVSLTKATAPPQETPAAEAPALPMGVAPVASERAVAPSPVEAQASSPTEAQAVALGRTHADAPPIAPAARIAAGAAGAAIAAAPRVSVPVEVAVAERRVERPSVAAGGMHVCFSWRRGHASSTQCYASIESCNAERRALPAADELSRCGPRVQAFCTRLLQGDLPGERHCFGDAARCLQFQAEVAEQSPTSPCTAQTAAR